MQLVKYDAACKAISEAKSVDEIKHVHNISDAMRAYAKQAKNKQLEIDAAEIRIRAERRLGEIIRDQKETVGLNKGGNPKLLTGARQEPVATLADAGIDKKLSSRAQKIAAVPQKEFDGMMKEWREEVAQVGERVTTNIIKRGEVEKTKRDIRPIKIPEGKYSTIVIDPPWPVESMVLDKWESPIDEKYPTMSIQQITDMDIKGMAHDDCALFMWTTHTYLKDALNIIDAWGFKYHCCITWDKVGGFSLCGFHRRTEFCIYSYKGKMNINQSGEFIPTIINESKRKHSQKPKIFDELMRTNTSKPRIEIFAREKKEGFDTWGNQL
jgi:N6-adenosine-specific RNA methylase IME4